MEVPIAYIHTFNHPPFCYEVAEPESDEDFTRDDDRDVDSDYDVEDDSDAQKSGDKSSRSLMKSTFGYEHTYIRSPLTSLKCLSNCAVLPASLRCRRFIRQCFSLPETCLPRF